jgi:HSP20 family protein
MSLARRSSIWDNWVDDLFTTPFIDLPRVFKSNGDFPAVNVKETKDRYIVEAAVPGFEKNEINVTVKNGMLTIHGEKKSQQNGKDGERLTRSEFSYQMFSRSFSLPEDVLEEQIHAHCKEGVLTLELNRNKQMAEAEKKKQIPIE